MKYIHIHWHHSSVSSFFQRHRFQVKLALVQNEKKATVKQLVPIILTSVGLHAQVSVLQAESMV